MHRNSCVCVIRTLKRWTIHPRKYTLAKNDVHELTPVGERSLNRVSYLLSIQCCYYYYLLVCQIGPLLFASLSNWAITRLKSAPVSIHFSLSLSPEIRNEKLYLKNCINLTAFMTLSLCLEQEICCRRLYQHSTDHNCGWTGWREKNMDLHRSTGKKQKNFGSLTLQGLLVQRREYIRVSRALVN